MIDNNDCRIFGAQRHSPIKIFLFVVAGITLATGAALLLGVVVQWLWNHTITDIFAIKPITFWQSVGILVLSRLLLGGFGHHNQRKHIPGRLHSHLGSKIKETIHSRFGCTHSDVSSDDDIPDDKTLDQYLDTK